METDVQKRIKKVTDEFNKMADRLRLISFGCDSVRDDIIEFNTILGELWNDDIISDSFFRENKIDFDYAKEDTDR